MKNVALEVYEVKKKGYSSNLVISYSLDNISYRVFNDKNIVIDLLKRRFYNKNKRISVELILSTKIKTEESLKAELEKLLNSPNDRIFTNNHYLYEVARIETLYSNLDKKD